MNKSRFYVETEAKIQKRCAQLYAALGGKVYWLSQKRPSGQSAGLPDLIVVFRGRAVIFHECKTPRAMQYPHLYVRPEQHELRELLAGTAVKHVLGGFDEAWNALKDLGFAVSGLPASQRDPKLEPSASNAVPHSEVS